MTRMDDTPFEPPHYDTSFGSDYSDRINRRLDFEEQEQINEVNKKEQQREHIKT